MICLKYNTKNCKTPVNMPMELTVDSTEILSFTDSTYYGN
ncbi:MAG: hypothetical protein Pg6B_07480 [Candidatus Azobacteroides pseudotrichonymphae]|nr:MAG: hypothetical protein Pg6B_07480 [Candidatus Azobacteroides pseudotrichonymphae]